MSIPYRHTQQSQIMLAQELPLSCGAACARELLRGRGIVHDERTVREAAFYSPAGPAHLQGIGEAGLAAAMTALGGAPWTGASLPDAKGRTHALAERWAPLVVMLDLHWVILVRVAGSDVEILDPQPHGGTLFATEAVLQIDDFGTGFQAGRYRAVFRSQR